MKIICYKDRIGDWRWKLMADNGQIIADSGEGYRNSGDMTMVLNSIFNSEIERVYEGSPDQRDGQST